MERIRNVSCFGKIIFTVENNILDVASDIVLRFFSKMNTCKFASANKTPSFKK